MVPGHGPSPCDILILGEAPGAQEEKAGKPFIGHSGSELWGILGGIGLTRKDCYVTNLVKDRPPENRDPLPEEIEAWAPILETEVRACQPRLVIALGRFATSWALARPVTMERDYGLLHRPGLPLGHLAPDCLVLASYHPAAALHSPEIYTLLWRGLRQVGPWLEGARDPVEDQHPSPVYEDASQGPSEALYGQRSDHVGVDTEGTLEGPLGASYSLSGGTGLWANAEAPVPAVHAPVMHNALWDIPILEQLGCVVQFTEDTMIMAHILGEPRVGLKALAWRHCGMTLSDYGDMVGPAQQAIAYDYLGALLAAYVPQFQPRISEKTGKVLKPKLLPAEPVFKAAARCLKSADPYTLWRQQRPERHDEAKALVGATMREATLEDV